MKLKITIPLAGALVAGTLLATATPSQAGLLGGLSSALNPSAPPTNSAETANLGQDLTGLNGRFASSMREMLMAQALTLLALGDQAKGDQLTTEAKSLQGVNDINVVARSITVSESASTEINQKMKASTKLSRASKGDLASAVPYYLAGSVQAAGLPNAYQSWIARARSSATGGGAIGMLSGGGLGNLGSVVTVTSKLPSLISTWGTTTHNFVRFAQGNQVNTGDLASKI